MSRGEATASEATPEPEDRPAAGRAAGILDTAFGLATAAVLLVAFVGISRLNGVDEGDLRAFGGDSLDHIPIKVSTIVMGQIFLVVPAVLLLARLILRTAGGAVDRAVAAVTRRPALTVGLLALTALAATALFSWLVLGHNILTDDENIQLYQAQLIEHGRLSAPVPMLRAFFDQPRLAYLAQDQWTGVFPFGHAALLAAGDAVGFPQLWPHLSAPLVVVLTYLLAREARPDETGAGTALAAAALVATSPFLVLTAGTLHNATTSVVCVTLGAYLLARHRRRGGLASAILAGVAFGADLHARPLNAMILGGATLLVAAIALRREGKSLRPLLAGFALGIAPWMAAHGAIDWILAGNPFRAVITKGSERPIFGFGNLAFGAYHTPYKAFGQMATNVFEIVLWASGTIMTALGLVVGAAAPRSRRLEWLWLAPPGALVVMYYFFFRTPPIDTGPTYFLDVLPFLAIFLARVLAGAPLAVARLRGRSLAPAERTGAARASVLIPALAVLTAFGSFWPAHVHGAARSAESVAAPHRAIAAAGVHHAVVFWRNPPTRRSDVTQPPMPSPDLDDDILFVRDRRDSDEIAAAFPDRALYNLSYERGNAVLRPWQPPPPSAP